MKNILYFFMRWAFPLVLTSCVFVIAFFIARSQVSNCWEIWTSWPVLPNKLPATTSCLTPNEIGDFLAGVFAPIAFIWLAYAVVLQSKELRAQQREMAAMASQMGDQAKAMEITAKLQSETAAHENLMSVLQLWRKRIEGIATGLKSDITDLDFFLHYGLQSHNRLLSAEEWLQQDGEDGRTHEMQQIIQNAVLLYPSCRAVMALSSQLSETDRLLYQSMHLYEISECILNMCKQMQENHDLFKKCGIKPGSFASMVRQRSKQL